MFRGTICLPRVVLALIVVYSVLLTLGGLILKWESTVRQVLALGQVRDLNEFAISFSKDTTMPLQEKIEYLKTWYPSGTKQRAGSLVDRIVESHRELAIEYVMAIERCNQSQLDIAK